MYLTLYDVHTIQYTLYTGTGDDNCHYQGMEVLINTLITHNKPYQMLSYPNRTHSINEGYNTTRHLFAAITRFLNDKVL